MAPFLPSLLEPLSLPTPSPLPESDAFVREPLFQSIQQPFIHSANTCGPAVRRKLAGRGNQGGLMLITPVLQGEDQGSEGLLCMSGRVEGKAGGSVLPSLSLCCTARMFFPQRPPWPLPPTWMARALTFHRAPGLQRRLALTILDGTCLRSPPPPPHCGGAVISDPRWSEAPPRRPRALTAPKCAQGPRARSRGLQPVASAAVRPPRTRLRSRQAGLQPEPLELPPDGKTACSCSFNPGLP